MADPIGTGALKPLEAPAEWTKVARQALALSDTAYARKMGRARLATLLADLATGIPFETACQTVGLRPNMVREWAKTRPAIGDAIEMARGTGAKARIKRIDESPDWKAQQWLLQIAAPEFAPKSADSAPGQSGSGPTINVTIHVPRPELAIAGHGLPVIEAQAVVVDGPETTPTSAPET